MAKKTKNVEKRRSSIDPVYQKFSSGFNMALRGDDFYEYFLENLRLGSTSVQFSNRHLEKKIDEKWIVAIEDCMEAFRNIIMNPRNFIIEKEEVVNVAVARQSTPDVLIHLTTHGQFIDDINEDNVRPNHLLNKFKEDSWNTYENRFVYTLLEKTIEFVSKRYDAIFGNMDGEFGAFMKVEADSKNDADTVSTKFDVRIKRNEDYLADDAESMDIFNRLKKINESLHMFNQSLFAQTLRQYPRVKNPIVKTNAIQKNPNFKACYKLWVFLHAYKEVGYEINIYEQSTEIKPEFVQDIEKNIFSCYLTLKNYLETDADRRIDISKPHKKRTLKPKFIKKIIEEIVQNYDVTDTEIRKVLIEEFTKAQLSQLEEKERRKMVEQKEREEAAKRKKEAELKKRQQEKLQRERARKLRAQEEALARMMKAQERRNKQLDRLLEDCKEEFTRFTENRKRILDGE